MKTPKSYVDNLKSGIITRNMLHDALFSVNKRAKNYRDKETEYRRRRKINRYYYDKYDNEEKNREKKNEYYKKKEILLSLISPACIHRELVGYERERIYDYDIRYDKYFKKGDYVWSNSYYDYEEYTEVWFIDILNKNRPIYNYYLFYDFGMEHTFHSPINEDQLSKYNLEIIDIDKLDTFGEEIEDLLSIQFVDKVIALINQGNFILK